MAEVVEDQGNVDRGYTQLNYMSIKGKNSFSWGAKQDVVVTLDEDIILENVVPEPVGNRGHFALKKTDVQKVNSWMVVVYLLFFKEFHQHFPYIKNPFIFFYNLTFNKPQPYLRPPTKNSKIMLTLYHVLTINHFFLVFLPTFTTPVYTKICKPTYILSNVPVCTKICKENVKKYSTFDLSSVLKHFGDTIFF